MLHTLGRAGCRVISRLTYEAAAELSVSSGPLLEAAAISGGCTHVCTYFTSVNTTSCSYSTWQGRAELVDGICGEASTSSTARPERPQHLSDEPVSQRSAHHSCRKAKLSPVPGHLSAVFPAAVRGFHSSAARGTPDLPDQDARRTGNVPESVQGSPETPFESLEDFDQTLERWEGLLEEGDYDGVLELLNKTYANVPGLPPIEQILQRPNEEDQEKAERRAREEALQEEFAQRRTRLVDELGRAYATGKRKCSVARVWIKSPPPEREGLGRVMVNGRPLDEYFKVLMRRTDVLQPFIVTDQLGHFDVRATVTGGGTTGQAQAVRHGISKALQLWDPDFRPVLKANGLLTRDSRVVERKKPGKAKARKSFQWVKR